MYAVNDTVMYGQSGICRITEICDKKFGRETKKYYVLRQIFGDNTVIYCPVDSDKAHIRKLLSAEDIIALIRELPAQQGDWIENDNLRKERQTEILRRGDHRELISMIKTLYQEFAQVLDIAPDEVVPFITEKIEKQPEQI